MDLLNINNIKKNKIYTIEKINIKISDSKIYHDVCEYCKQKIKYINYSPIIFEHEDTEIKHNVKNNLVKQNKFIHLKLFKHNNEKKFIKASLPESINITHLIFKMNIKNILKSRGIEKSPNVCMKLSQEINKQIKKQKFNISFFLNSYNIIIITKIKIFSFFT